MSDEQTKRCTKCDEVKPLSEFHHDRTKHDGHMSTCKACRCDHMRKYRVVNHTEITDRERKYRAANKEKITERKREYYVKNKEQIAEYGRGWREVNSERLLEKSREYYEKNKEALREKSREYYAANKEKVAEWQRKYYEANKEKILERVRDYQERNHESEAERGRRYRKENRESLRKSNAKYRKCVKNPACPAVGGRGAKFVTFTCEVCGTEFRRRKKCVDWNYEHHGSLPRFCSKSCMAVAQRKDYKPPYARNIERIKKEVGA